MMRLLAVLQVTAGKTVAKVTENRIVKDRLNCFQFYSFYNIMKIRVLVVVFNFCRNSDISIIKSITYKICKSLINKVKILLFYVDRCSYFTYVNLFRVTTHNYDS